MRMRPEVAMDRTAVKEEVEAVRHAFAAVGIEADIHADIEYRGVGDYPWVIYITVAAVPFLAAFGKAMGTQVGDAAGRAVVTGTTEGARQLAAFVKSLYAARRLSPVPRGTVLLTDTEAHEHVVLTEDAPEEAYQLLLDLDIQHTRSGQIEWDAKAQEWRDPLGK